MVTLRRVRSKPCKGYMYRVIGYNNQGQQVGYMDVMNFHQALYAAGELEEKRGASATVIYDKQGKELGGYSLDTLKILKRG